MIRTNRWLLFLSKKAAPASASARSARMAAGPHAIHWTASSDRIRSELAYKNSIEMVRLYKLTKTMRILLADRVASAVGSGPDDQNYFG